MTDLSDRSRALIGRAIASASIVVGFLSLLVAATVQSPAELYRNWIIHNILSPVGLAILGWILVGAQPRNRVVWLLLWTAVVNLINGVAQTAVEWMIQRGDLPDDLSTGPADLSMLEAVAVNVTWWVWVPPVAMLGSLALLLFPDGRLPSPRWRPVVAMAVVGTATVSAVLAWQTRPFGDYSYPTGAVEDDASPFMGLALTVGFVILIVSVALSLASLVVRYRASRGFERRRLRWIVWGAGVMVGLAAPAFVLDLAIVTANNDLFAAASLSGVVFLYTGYGLAIWREQLFDIDVVLSRTILVGFLSLFITGCYVAIVFGVGALVGRRGGDQTLSLMATIAVAFAFQPVRRRFEHLANRMVYGRRATPHEVLSDLTGRLTNAVEVGGLLDRLVERLADGTGADSATLWRASETGFEPAARWPADSTAPVGSALSGGSVAQLPDGNVAIQRAGTVLGALSIVKRRGEEITPTEQRLMADLAGSAALVLDKARLDSALEQQANQLFESRRRQVDAQDEERQRLERHLNETTHRQLLGLEESIDRAVVDVGEDGVAKVAEQLVDLGDQARTAADEVQALAQGIFPPLLETDGLVSAVRSLAEGLPLPIEVHGQATDQGADLDIDSAIYFCVAEALTNVVKHADASQATVSIETTPDSLSFTVADDGQGFDSAAGYGLSTGLPGIADRLEAVGGNLTIESEVGHGTTITGNVARTAIAAQALAGLRGG